MEIPFKPPASIIAILPGGPMNDLAVLENDSVY